MTTTRTAFAPPINELPVPLDHWGERLPEEDYGLLMVAGGHLLAGLQAYHWHHKRPGGFLCALIANDLADCVLRADPVSTALLKQLVWYVHNEMPSTSHGSKQALDAWAPEE